MRNMKLVVSTLGLLGAVAGSSSAVTLFSSSSYSRIEYDALPVGVVVLLSQNGGPVSATSNGLGISSTTNNGGTAPIRAELDALTAGSVDIINTHSDATAIAGAWNILLKNNTNSAKTMSIMWHWSVAALAIADTNDTAFAYATSSIGGNVISDFKQEFVVSPDNLFASGDNTYPITIQPNGIAFISVSATAGGTADIANIPEPGAIAMLIGAGISVTALLRRRRK